MGPADENRDEGLRLVNFGKARFCVNCQHIGTNGAGEAKLFRCFAPQNVDLLPDLVTGGKLYLAPTCYSARNEKYWCGPEGKWWEQKVAAPPLQWAGKSAASADKLLDDLENL